VAGAFILLGGLIVVAFHSDFAILR